MRSLSHDSLSHFAYFDPFSTSSYIEALDQLAVYVSAEGPFDGVLAFSQGAGLAATYILRTRLQDPTQKPPFKCAFFLSSVGVYDVSACGEMRTLDSKIDGELITIPTAHAWGIRDEMKEQCESLSKLCSKDKAAVLVHEGGHEVPGIGVKDAVSELVKVLRRAIMHAALG